MDHLVLAIRRYGQVDLDNFEAAYQRHMVKQRGPFDYAKFLQINGRRAQAAPHWVAMDGCNYLSTEAFLRSVLETLETEAKNASGMPAKRRRMWENIL